MNPTIQIDSEGWVTVDPGKPYARTFHIGTSAERVATFRKLEELKQLARKYAVHYAEKGQYEVASAFDALVLGIGPDATEGGK